MKVLLITWFITHFEPLQELIEAFFNKQKSNFINNCLLSLLTCWKCQSFWVAIVYTQNIIYATLISFIAWLLSSLIEKFQKN